MEFDLAYISELLQALLLAILPVLATAGVRWLLKEGQLQAAKLTNEQQLFLTRLIKVGVLAAEQFGLVADAKNYIFDKKAYVVGFVGAQLDVLGLTVDEKYIADSIEAAVMEEFNRWNDFEIKQTSGSGVTIPEEYIERVLGPNLPAQG